MLHLDALIGRHDGLKGMDLLTAGATIQRKASCAPASGSLLPHKPARNIKLKKTRVVPVFFTQGCSSGRDPCKDRRDRTRIWDAAG
jgi:hypothetical protein